MLGLQSGEVAKALSMFFNGKERMTLDMNILRTHNLTKYPFVLILEQSKSEALMEEFLRKRGVQINRQLRGKLQLSFPGNTYEQSLFVIDCHVRFFEQIKGTRTVIHNPQFNITKSGFTILFPLKGHAEDGLYRVTGTIPLKLLKSSKEVEFEDIQASIGEHLERRVEIYDPLWMTTYRSHHRYVEEFVVKKKYFLLGEAAHIHSPVGGIGMNTGLQDAFNLGWKLAFTIQDKTVNNNELIMMNESALPKIWSIQRIVSLHSKSYQSIYST